MIRVIVVEDQRLSAERYASWIADFGHGFTVTAICLDAAQAIEACRRSTPDVIFSDIRLPRQDGLEMLEELRSGGWTGQAVIVSGHNDFTYARRAIQLQAIDYLLKPVFPEDMQRTLQQLLPRFQEGEESIEGRLIGPGRRTFPPFILRALDFVAANYSGHVSLVRAAGHAFVSPAYLSTSFRRVCGCTFVEYVRRFRIEHAKRLLTSGTLPLDEIARQVGVEDVAYFRRLFKRVEHTTPGCWRRERRAC